MRINAVIKDHQLTKEKREEGIDEQGNNLDDSVWPNNEESKGSLDRPDFGRVVSRRCQC